MLDLNKLAEKLTIALENETKESLEEWLEERRRVTSEAQLIYEANGWFYSLPNGTELDKGSRSYYIVKYYPELRYIGITEKEQVVSIYLAEQLKKKDFNNKLSKLVVEPSKKGIKLQKRLERMDSYHDKVFEIALLLIDKIKESGDTKEVAAEKLMITKKRLRKILKARANLKISEIFQMEKEYKMNIFR